MQNPSPARFWHFLRENKVTRTPTRFVVVDTETTPRKKRHGRVNHSLWFGCAYFFTMPIGAKKKAQCEFLQFNTRKQFWDFVDAHAAPRTRLVLSAHNLAFDFITLNGARELKRRGFDLPFPIVEGLRFIGHAKNGNRTIDLWDTLNYIPTTLVELGRALGLVKYKMPSRRASFKKWSRYCQRDALILKAFWEKLVTLWRENDYGTFAPTASGLAFKLFRHKFLTTPILIHAQKSVLKLERAAYRGGRCEPFFVGKLPRGKYYLLDVNSLYPSVMRENVFPTRLVGSGCRISLEVLRGLLNNYYVIARVEVKTQMPAYPVERSGLLIFPVGYFVTTLSDCELRHALARGDIVGVSRVAFYERAPLFREYVDTLYRARWQCTDAGLPAFGLFYKMLLNSLYGRFGMRGHTRVIEGKSNENNFAIRERYDAVRKVRYRVTTWNGLDYVESNRGEARDSFPAIAAGVTALGRLKLWQLICKAGRASVFYVDTDSLIVNEAGLARLLEEQSPRELGKLRLELVATRGEIRGVKDYTLGDRVRRKGIRKDAFRLSEMEWRQQRFLSFHEILREGFPPRMTQITEHKRAARPYVRGVVGADGRVSPLSL